MSWVWRVYPNTGARPASGGRQKCDFLPQVGGGADAGAGCVSSEPTVVGHDRALDYFHEVVRSDAFAPAVLTRYAQIDGPRALERVVSPGAELPEAVGVSGRDAIVRTPESSIRTDSEIRAPYQHG